MFRMASPWGYGPCRDDDYASFPFEAYGAPTPQIRASAPFEDFFGSPLAYGHPAQRSARVPLAAMAYPRPYSRAPTRDPAYIPALVGVDPYSGVHHPYGMPYIRRPAAPAVPYIDSPAGARPHLDGLYVPYTETDEDAVGEGASSRRRAQTSSQPQPQWQRQPAAVAAKKRSMRAASSDDRSMRAAPSDDRDGANSDADTDASTDTTSSAPPQQPQQPQPILLLDPASGLFVRAVMPPGSGGSCSKQRVKAAAPAGGRKEASSGQPAATTCPSTLNPRAHNTRTQPSTEGLHEAPGQNRQPQPSSAAASASGGGPTRIQVRVAGPTKDPVPVAAVRAAASTGPSTPSLNRQGSSAIVTRPSMEVALSRGPSVTLPSANAAAAAAVGSAAAAAAKQHASTSRGEFKRVPVVAASTAKRATNMTRSQAARIIQSWWRGWRLWRHAPDFRKLMAVARELRDAAARYYGYMGATAANITHKHLLEINELAMRVILKLDSMEGMPPEFRALRKHLTSRALRLQDEVHSSYAASAARPDITRSASSAVPEAPPAAPPAAPAGSGPGISGADNDSQEAVAKGATSNRVKEAASPSSQPPTVPAPPPPPPPPSRSGSGQLRGVSAALGSQEEPGTAQSTRVDAAPVTMAAEAGTANGGAGQENPEPMRKPKQRRARRLRRRLQRALRGLVAPPGHPRSVSAGGTGDRAVLLLGDTEQQLQQPVVLQLVIRQPCTLDQSGRCANCMCMGRGGKQDGAEVQAD